MDILQFKAGTYRKGVGYRYFLPNSINHTFSWNDPELNELLEKASLKIGELNAYARFVPDVGMFIRLHVVKEAVVSSQIEGTQTQLEEALQEKEDIVPENRDDWQEVNNYVKALDSAIESLEKLPLSNRLLRQTHKILLQGARGERKNPGEFRTSQNWIGGATLVDAVFIPPTHTEVPELMSDLERFLHNTEIHVPHLIKVAIAHYQFETIHPFLDGNGRLGRLLISLYLVDNKILEKPLLYLSDFFNKNRLLYFDKLTIVRTQHDLRQWLIFFLVAVIETTQKATTNLQAIAKLRQASENQIIELGKRASNGKKLLDYLFSQPLIKTSDVEKILNLSPKSAGSMIQEFESMEILQELTGYQRNRTYAFKRYLDLFK